MRLFLFCMTLVWLTMPGFGQTPRRSKPFIYSATSEWQKVSFKPTTRLRPAQAGVAQADQSRSTPGTRAAITPSGVAQPATNQSGAAQPGDMSPNATQPTVVQSAPTAVSPPSQPMPTEVPPPSRSRMESPSTSSAAFRPAFTGDFATNRNGWKAGISGDYHYQIGMGRYSIRKRNATTQQVAFSYVPLPPDINLNAADQFTVKIDVLADSGRVPTGGLLFGVRDSLNFNAFTLNSKGEVSIVRVANGETFSDYMPGDFFKPGVPVDRNRNRLTIRRKGYALHFYINEQEIRTSPYRFKMLAGNSVGMISSGYWTAFQKLSVTLGASGPDLPTTYVTAADTPSPETATFSEKTVSPATAPTPTPIETPAPAGAAPTNTFTETFATNKNRWLTGKKNGYELDVNLGSYYIRKIASSAVNPAHSYIHLPENLDLNKAESFTITAEMIVPPGTQLDGGLLIGVKNINTFCQFRLIGNKSVSIKSIANGSTFANYMPGKPTAPKVTVNRDRNILTVKKELNQLHFFINGQEVEDSPHVFRPFKGNGVGFITASPTVKFQNLSVQVASGQ